MNRVGNQFSDQLELSGHLNRIEDLDRFAALGLKAIRYPILWEHISPRRPNECVWGPTDARLHHLRTLGIRVIAGLVHHGSGPRYTGLLESSFAPGLARHAHRTARRYPWIDAWTPVNEPLTTARFSALYGHWYPHARDEGAFWLALLNQVDATRLAMRAVRQINPSARLIQTDDLGRTYATASLRQQAGFDNLRRWAGWDLLCGKLTPDHGLWARIARHGLADRLRAIADDPCPPDVIGINHYLTSDRFLDHRLHRYPLHLHGGSDVQKYIDTEAVRVLEPAPNGLRGALREAWERYGLPVAITEVHNGCTREEQMRWMAQAWDIAVALRQEGVPVQAVTAWALLGSSGWNTLLTGPGRYEAGAWDATGTPPRETALNDLIKALPIAGERHPLATSAGWWQRPVRAVHPPVPRPAPAREHFVARRFLESTRPLLICGATGTLGQAIAGACRLRNIAHVLTGRAQLDLSRSQDIDNVLREHDPWAVVNAAGWVRVDEAEDAPEECMAANARGAVLLATACAARGITSLSFSSDLIFDGAKGHAYIEPDLPAPLNIYGASKARMEKAIAALDGSHLVIRTAAFFSAFDRHNFAVGIVEALARGERPLAPDDLIISPTYVPHLVSNALDLLIDGESGLWHLTNGDAVSWAEFARLVAIACSFSPDRICGVPHQELDLLAPRPRRVPLASVRGALMPPLGNAIGEFAAQARKSGLLDAREPINE